MRVHCVNYLPLLSLRLFCSSSNLVLTCTVLLHVIVTCASWSISFWRLKFFSNEFKAWATYKPMERTLAKVQWNRSSLTSSHRVIYSAFNSLCQRTLTFAKLTRTSGALSLGSLELKRSSKCILELNYLAEDIARRKLRKNACKSYTFCCPRRSHKNYL